jgi:hypothetical protein
MPEEKYVIVDCEHSALSYNLHGITRHPSDFLNLTVKLKDKSLPSVLNRLSKEPNVSIIIVTAYPYTRWLEKHLKKEFTGTPFSIVYAPLLRDNKKTITQDNMINITPASISPPPGYTLIFNHTLSAPKGGWENYAETLWQRLASTDYFCKLQEQQELERQELERQELERQELERQELERQELERQELERQELERKELERQELERQELERQELERQELERQELERQELERQELERQELERKELERQELERKELERKELERKELERQELKQMKKEEKLSASFGEYTSTLRFFTPTVIFSAQMDTTVIPSLSPEAAGSPERRTTLTPSPSHLRHMIEKTNSSHYFSRIVGNEAQAKKTPPPCRIECIKREEAKNPSGSFRSHSPLTLSSS